METKMDDFDKLIEQLQVDDPYYFLSSTERKELRALIQATQQMMDEANDRREEIWVEIESAPPDSPWKQTLTDELGRVTADFIARCNVTVARINEAKRKNREMSGGAHLTPKFTATVEDLPGEQTVHLRIEKFGHEGVYIQWRQNNGAWALRSINPNSSYYDSVPLLVANTPETREYRMKFWDNGKPNGEWSEVAKVTVGGVKG